MSVDTSSTTTLTSVQQPQREAGGKWVRAWGHCTRCSILPRCSCRISDGLSISRGPSTFRQAILVKEASEALKASESHVSAMQEELMTLKRNREADIQRAVGNMVSQYEHQLSSAQSHTRDHQSAIAFAGAGPGAPSLRWLVKGICLQWVHPKGRWISRRRCSTSSQGWSTPTGVLQSIIHPTNLSNSKSRSDSGTGLTSLIWSQILLLVWVHNLVTFHLMLLHLSMGQVRYR